MSTRYAKLFDPKLIKLEMNYSQGEKVLDDLEQELNFIYNLVNLLSEYMELKDTKTNPNNINDKFVMISTISDCLNDYNDIRKVNTTNLSILNNRKDLNMKIKTIRSKLLSDRSVLERDFYN